MNGSITFDGSLVGNITGGGGGGGDTVVITPVVTSGTKIADVSVNGVEKDLYCPTPPTPPQIDITPVVTSGTKIADVSVGGVEKDLYAPNPTTVNVTQVQQSGTKIATIGVNGVNTDIYAPEGGGIIYSLEEHVIGKWIDEKPIYQKTYIINETIYNQDKTIDVSDLNIKKYVNGYGTFLRIINWASPIILIDTPFNLYESNINRSYLRHGKSTNTIDYGIYLGNNETATDITITIQYTKTTD